MNKNNINKIIFLFFIFLFCLFISLFYNENREIFASGECVVDPTIEIRHAEFPKGKIPIGEAVDEAELLAQKIIDEQEIIFFQIISMRDEALSMREEARLEINEAWRLIDLTSPGTNNSQDCVNNCPDACTSDCRKTTGECCEEECETSGDPPETTCWCVLWWKYCKCQTCEGFPCNFGSITNAYNQIENHSGNIESYYNILKDRPAIISNPKDRISDLTNVQNLLPDDPNRWEILNKLLNSRVKLEECLTGYGSVIQEIKTKMKVLSCETALDKIYLGELNIIGYFEDNITPFPHCYPYYASETALYKQFIEENIQPICETNKDSLECQEAIRSFMNNYFCCEGE